MIVVHRSAKRIIGDITSTIGISPDFGQIVKLNMSFMFIESALWITGRDSTWFL
jgi:hypothetical protein